MITRIYCVKDRATEVFGTPMFLMANGQAIRSFTDEVNRSDKDNSLYLHPDDYDLYFCGTWDNANGSFDTIIPEILCRGKDVSTKVMGEN